MERALRISIFGLGYVGAVSAGASRTKGTMWLASIQLLTKLI